MAIGLGANFDSDVSIKSLPGHVGRALYVLLFGRWDGNGWACRPGSARRPGACRLGRVGRVLDFSLGCGVAIGLGANFDSDVAIKSLPGRVGRALDCSSGGGVVIGLGASFE